MRIVIIVLTLLWFFIGAKVASNKFCEDTSKPASSSLGVLGVTGDDCDAALVFIDKEGSLEINSPENFQFIRSSPDVMGTTSEMASVLEQLTSYLNKNPGRFMEITGFYLETEENNTDKENLGKARATSVRSYLMSKGIDGKQLTTKGMMDNSICTTEEKILKGAKVAFSKIPTN